MTNRARDDGFGIAEALIAILLFGILAVALVPPIVLALQVSSKSTTIASAASVANERIELARQSSTSCVTMLAFMRTAIPTYNDARGVAFTVIQTPSATTAAGYAISPAGGTGDADADGVRDTFCKKTAVTAVSFAVSVTSTSPGHPDAAQAATIIAVPGLGD